MAPGQKITIKLANALTDWETLKKKEINLSVESKNILNSKITEKFQLSFDHFDGLYDTSDQRLSKITASLNNIDKALSGLASGTKKAKVISYSLEDIKTEAEHLNKRYQQTNNEEEREPNSITSHG
jgi:acyl carrier protein phosphodiesterase